MTHFKVNLSDKQNIQWETMPGFDLDHVCSTVNYIILLVYIICQGYVGKKTEKVLHILNKIWWKVTCFYDIPFLP